MSKNKVTPMIENKEEFLYEGSLFIVTKLHVLHCMAIDDGLHHRASLCFLCKNSLLCVKSLHSLYDQHNISCVVTKAPFTVFCSLC